MKREQLSDALQFLADDILEETDALRQSRDKPVHIKSVSWRKWGALAACLCLILTGAVGLQLQGRGNPGNVPGPSTDEVRTEPNSDLPLLHIDEKQYGGYGFAGVMYYDIAEQNTGDPWRETMSLTTMPVYRSGIRFNGGEAIGLDEAAMTEKLKTAAQALGVEIEDENIERMYAQYLDDETTGKPGLMLMSASVNGVGFTVNSTGAVTIRFEDGLALPEEYHFTDTDTSEAEAKKVMVYLLDEYAALLNFDKPQIILPEEYGYVDDGTDSREVEKRRRYMAYDSQGDDTEAILNYAFRSAEFYPDDDGTLSGIHIDDSLACAEKLGDYPLISADEARELLLGGNYITSAPYPIAGEAYVADVELDYRSGMDETYLPYYCFYVELPEMEEADGLKTYGIYYVPAIEGKYIENMPLYDGWFN